MVRHVAMTGGGPRPLERREIELRMRVHAGRARSALAASAERRRVRWSFGTMRGAIESSLLGSASARDLVTAGAIGWSARTSGPGRTARALLASSPGCVLLLGEKASPRGPVCVVFDGSSGGGKALSLAAQIAGLRGAPLSVWLVPPRGAGGDDLQEAARLRLAGEKPDEVEWQALSSLRDVPGLVRRARPGLVVLPGETSAVADLALDVAGSMEVSVLRVR